MRVKLQPGEKLIVEMADSGSNAEIFAEFEIHNETKDYPKSYVVKANYQPVESVDGVITLYHAEFNENYDWVLRDAAEPKERDLKIVKKFTNKEPDSTRIISGKKVDRIPNFAGEEKVDRTPNFVSEGQRLDLSAD